MNTGPDFYTFALQTRISIGGVQTGHLLFLKILHKIGQKMSVKLYFHSNIW